METPHSTYCYFQKPNTAHHADLWVKVFPSAGSTLHPICSVHRNKKFCSTQNRNLSFSLWDKADHVLASLFIKTTPDTKCHDQNNPGKNSGFRPQWIIVFQQTDAVLSFQYPFHRLNWDLNEPPPLSPSAIRITPPTSLIGESIQKTNCLHLPVETLISANRCEAEMQNEYRN